VNICTIIARNYVAHARVLAESFNRFHPDGTCSVLVIDDPSGFIDADSEPFELITLDQIELPSVDRMAASYDVMELSTAVKPWLLRHLLARPEVDSIAYLDPDIKVFDSLAEIERRAREHNVVLTPHFTDPLLRDDRKPSEEDILIAGTYNLGFIALGAGEIADQLLDWWSERLEHHCINDPEQGWFVDQRWIDLAPGLWPGIDVLRDTSFNIAYWNLPTRQLELDGDGYRVDGAPLHFFHFSGFDPRHPDRLSKHQDRVEVGRDPALTRICAEYAADLLRNGFEQANDWPYGWTEMANGARLDAAARRVHREAAEAGEFEDSVFTEQGAQRFVAFLSEPEGGDRTEVPVNRYARAVWDARPDFRRIFPDIQGENGAEFVHWLDVTAYDTGIVAEFLPHAPRPAGPPREPAPQVQVEPGINVVGYLSSSRGVGEAARQMLAALEDGEVPTARIDTPADPGEIPGALERLKGADYPYDTNLICVNADMLPAVAAGLGSRFFDFRHSIGLWFWEVTSFPEQWQPSFDHLDEVWVASEHIAAALRPISTVPVRTVRVPVTPAEPKQLGRAEMGLPEGFCFLFVFDYRSVFKRKNPLGIVEAFRQAFPPGAGPSLVLKSVCGDEFPEQREALAAAVADRPDIHLVEEKLPVEVKDAMIASCDCYVSLHRSEGLGLTMAEAMYFGRPTIATAYSGNLDFMTGDNSCLVPYETTAIGDDAPPYPAHGEWAEPDLEYAARMMQKVYEDPDLAARLGRRAAADIRRTHSLAASCELIEARVAEVRRERLIERLLHPSVAPERPYAPPSGRDELEHLLELGVAPHLSGAGGGGDFGKRAYRRLLRPYAAYQHRINATTTQALDELRAMLVENLRLEAQVDAKLAATNERLRQLAEEVGRQRDGD
jgi:glycosyltransferase involved in cell wall biosynthesis